MARRELVPDELWKRIEPLLPPHPPRPKGGRPPADDRACLRGILFVLRTGIPWEDLPAEVFGVSGVTCWRRLRNWGEAGVFSALQDVRLAELRHEGKLDWSRAALDAFSVPAKKGARSPARTPRIGRNLARNTMSSPIARASRSSRVSRRPTSTTATKPCP